MGFDAMVVGRLSIFRGGRVCIELFTVYGVVDRMVILLFSEEFWA